jgi:phage shock protein A
MQQQVQVPTIEQLTQAITQLALQRANAKDQIEQLERQLPVLQAQLQLLQAQEQAEVPVED